MSLQMSGRQDGAFGVGGNATGCKTSKKRHRPASDPHEQPMRLAVIGELRGLNSGQASCPKYPTGVRRHTRMSCDMYVGCGDRPISARRGRFAGRPGRSVIVAKRCAEGQYGISPPERRRPPSHRAHIDVPEDGSTGAEGSGRREDGVASRVALLTDTGQERRGGWDRLRLPSAQNASTERRLPLETRPPRST